MLPSYSKQHPQDAEQAEPFLASIDVDVRTSSETAPPLYPPTSTPGTDGRHNVEYSYAPVYPRKGKIENVVGVLGNTKRVSLSRSALQERLQNHAKLSEEGPFTLELCSREQLGDGLCK